MTRPSFEKITSDSWQYWGFAAETPSDTLRVPAVSEADYITKVTVNPLIFRIS
jgi:hypothetical protein